MQRSSKFLILPLAAALLLAGCGSLKSQDDKPSSTIITGKPTTTPAKPGAQKPADSKPGTLQRPAEKGDPQQRFNEALALLKGNQIAEAEQSFIWMTQDFPEYAGPWTNLGILYAKSNRNSQAVVAFVRAVGINSDDAVAYNWLGILYRQARDYARAEASYKSALKADDRYGLAHLNLGILYDEYLKRPADALPHYKDYLKYGGKDDLRVQAWIAQIENPAAAAGLVDPTKGQEGKP